MTNSLLSDKYEFLKPLHQSAATAVTLVRHRQLEEIRVLKSANRKSPLSSCIMSEANLLSGLSSIHPGLPTIFDVEYGETEVCLVEEYIPGPSLLDYLLHKGSIDADFALRICISICDVFTCLHTAFDEPYLYLDLKPEHIILSNDDIRLIDFGAARKISEITDQIYTTTEYASYEQLTHGILDIRTDVCLIGIILEYMMRFMSEKEKTGLMAITKSTCHNNKEMRPQTVAALKEQLLKLMTGYNNITKSHQKRHSLNKITLVGSDRNAGTTHIAMTLCNFFNRSGTRCYYADHSDGRTLQGLMDCGYGFTVKDNIIYHDNFYGLIEYGEAVEPQSSPNGLYIIDAGTDRFEAELSDLVIYVISGCPWQLQAEFPPFVKEDNCIIIMNFGNRGRALSIAKELNKKVYLFPFLANPFTIGRDTEILLRKIFKQWV